MKIGREIIRLGRVASTMDVLDGYARAGESEGLVVVASEQTAGRGRAGRTWIAPAGHNLLCSILLRPTLSPNQLGVLPLVVGVAVAETIEHFVPQPCLVKWPNDVQVAERKIAGILIQSRISGTAVDFVNLGIGINVDVMHDALPAGATSIAAERGREVGCAPVLTTLLERLNRAYGKFLGSIGSPDLSDWRRRATMLGERVTVISETQVLSGVFEDIDASGKMLLRLDSGERVALVHGEVERGPRQLPTESP
jgi:BirA family transcriptional regulator, biotin operon repressor / biotin---[acetyl-CoA-carboxylase] ligase